MKCFNCSKKNGDYKLDKVTCGSCREVLKIDLVNIILGLDPIYLSENNRNKKGRQRKLTATEENDIKWNYNHPHENEKVSFRIYAKKYKVSVGTISNIIHKK